VDIRASADAAPDAGALDARLVRAIADLQRLISEGAAPEAVYQATVDETTRMLRADSSALRFVDRDDPGWMVAVAEHGCAGTERWRRRAPVSEGVSGQTISTGELVAVETSASLKAASRLAPAGTQAAIGAPIRERGRVIGALVASSMTAGRAWTAAEREWLTTYAHHAGIALAVARAAHDLEQAYKDSLTGLGNRAFLLDRLELKLARADRGGEPVTVLFLDLDRFKLVNDSLGHMVGDQLLIAVAERLRECTREGDVCARLGGDEFAVLLAGASEPAAVADRIIAAMQGRFEIDGHEVFISASVGIASGSEDAETLLRNADVAMYHAKRAASGRYEHYRPAMHAALVSRLGLEAELRRAIERDELELHYQPLFDLRSGAIVAFESLVRWRHPVRGLVPPLEFIPVAEETSLILDIDRWVLEEACGQLTLWWAQAPLALNINVSMRDLQQADHATVVERAINGAFPPSALVLEITESACVQDTPGALAALHALKDLGVRLALDDFGTGYSSLLSLSQMPVDMVKIPRPFLQPSAHRGRRPFGLLAGMIELGRQLGVTTVGEGIEEPAQQALLVELGCDLGQGYLLGRPQNSRAAEALLSTHGVAEARALAG
jgi:diguanylate cyclase (GGDEF)-like protein